MLKLLKIYASIMNVKAKEAVKIDAICFDRFLMRVLSIFEKDSIKLYVACGL